MFRNIHIDKKNKTVHLWEYENGKRIKKTEPFSTYFYVEDKSGAAVHKDIYGTPVIKKYTKNKYMEVKKFKSMGLKVCESDINEDIKFLQDRYHNTDGQPDMSQIHVAVVDIEVAGEDEFPEPDDALYPINLITIHSSITDKMYTFATSPLTRKCEGVEKYAYIEDELQMLIKFVTWWAKMGFDIVTGWMSTLFDVKYIINRIKRLTAGIQELKGLEKKLSPLGIVELIERSIRKQNGEVEVTKSYSIAGLSQLDYMELYKKFTFETRPSYSLNSIAMIEINQGKIDLEGSINHIYKVDWDLFTEYNIQDVRLVININKKLKFIELVVSLCYEALIPFERVFSSISVIEGFILRDLHDKKMVMPDRKEVVEDWWHKEGMYNVNGHPQNVKWEDGETTFNPFYIKGGYVKADPGFYKHNLSFDVESEYPHEIMIYNISPETKVIKPSEDEKKNLIASEINGVYYKKNVKGILPNIIERIFKERKHFKQLMFKYEKEGNHALAGYYDSRQMIRKIQINCFHPNTDIMTVDGIKKINEVSVGDLVYSINRETLELELKPVEKTYEYDYNGELIHLNNSQVDLRVTPEHKLLVLNNGKAEFVLAKDFAKNKRNIIPNNKSYKVALASEGYEVFDKKDIDSFNLYIDKLIKSGLQPRYTLVDDKYIVTTKEDNIVVNISDISCVKHIGKVYNLTVADNNTVYVGENGKFMWTGQSIYGVMGSKGFHFYDVDNARAVTRGGRQLIKFLARETNRYFKEFWHKDYDKYFDKIDNPVPLKNELVPVIDTDSVVGDSVVNTSIGDIKIEDLFNMSTKVIERRKDDYLGFLDNNIKSLSYNIDKKCIEYKTIKHVMKHKVSKEMFKVKVSGKEVIMTCDHSIIVNRNGHIIDVSPKEIIKGDKILRLVNKYFYWTEEFEIESIGVQEIDVYDIEVDDNHNFFANDVLVHNSNYLCFDELKQQYAPDMDFGEFAELMETKVLDPFYNKILDIYHAKKGVKNMIRYKREGVISEQFVLAKKKYITRLLKDEDKVFNPPKIKYKGVEVVRSDTPMFSRKHIKSVIEELFDNLDKDQTLKTLRETKKLFKKEPIENISSVSGINGYEKYAFPIDYYITNGLTFRKATPIHNRAAMCYNYLIRKNKYPYMEANNGTKIKYVYLNEQNILNSDVIAYIGNYPEQFKEIFNIDYDKQFEKTFMNIIQRMFNVLGWGKINLRGNTLSQFIKKKTVEKK